MKRKLPNMKDWDEPNVRLGFVETPIPGPMLDKEVMESIMDDSKR